MKLTRGEILRRLEERRLVISMIGMSNLGKSYLSKQLALIGFRRFCCDDQIELRLAPELITSGCSGIEDISCWMGQPYDERFARNQQLYLDCETEVMRELLCELANGVESSVVIDTTGSLVHTGHEICSALKQISLVVYLEASAERLLDMLRLYTELPKPVVFGDLYRPLPSETPEQTLARCYRLLLEARGKLYRQYADVVIPGNKISKGITGEEFLSTILQHVE